MTKQSLVDKQPLEIYTIEETSDGWNVYDGLKNQTFKVKRFRQKYVGPCSCDETAELPYQCPHQSAVRARLMDQWWYGKGDQ